MTLPRVSVVVVSWQRPAPLRRCLMSLLQQDHPAVEVILVAEPEAADVILPAFQKARLTVRFAANPGGNISAARNIGLSLAAGDVVAFIDDDAVAEPTWARRMAEAFTDPSVVAATGYTRGRNGISLQWGADWVDFTGHDTPETAAGLFTCTPARAIKPVGTNCAFRRSALLDVGGFDPAFRFYLEDADIGLRLAHLGKTAVLPDAQVMHAFAPSTRRDAQRVPLDLSDIGASTVVFLRKHAPHAAHAAALTALCADQIARAERHAGALRKMGRSPATLIATLQDGMTRGAAEPLTPRPPLPDSARDFLPLPGTGPLPGAVLAGRLWQRTALLAKAKTLRAKGFVVSLLILSPTPRAHRLTYTDDGIWLQTGGIFGRSLRSGPRLRLTTFARRLRAEIAHWSRHRPTNGP